MKLSDYTYEEKRAVIDYFYGKEEMYSIFSDDSLESMMNTMAGAHIVFNIRFKKLIRAIIVAFKGP